MSESLEQFLADSRTVALKVATGDQFKNIVPQLFDASEWEDSDLDSTLIECGCRVEIETTGGEGQGDYYEVALIIHLPDVVDPIIWVCATSYSSYDGVCWDYGDYYYAKPVIVPKVEYHQVGSNYSSLDSEYVEQRLSEGENNEQNDPTGE